MNELWLLISTFVLVFALGFQSLNVNGGHYVLAFLTSLVIGVANLVLFKLAPNATPTEMAAFLAGGPFGIVASMWVHRRYVRRPDGIPVQVVAGRDGPGARPHLRTIR